ncbi:predicted GTPase protein [Mycoplasma mobile 163K]|uniref:Predicted GTPase protein n=1 Tax=Mycoplasma mobile (strain ATCC 43663 / 163K / NCTC 11711) TaxID=267748 RepID=Q6KH84_MYCM1|nr:predicted GTPase protein [Mycoplasma mobile 163K]
MTRPKVSNLDQIILVVSLKEPDFNSYTLDKLLLIVEFKNIQPVIIFTKSDLLSESSKIPNLYEKQGYKVFLTSINDKNSYEKISQIFENKLSAFAGWSGVGKTTIINHLTNNNYETQQISKFLGRGKHTTRITQIIPFNKGWLIDTPGFSIFEHNLKKEEVSKAFFDFRIFANECEFRNCFHNKEKKCKVKDEVSKNNILQSRYDNYLRILSEVEDETY